MYIFKAMTYIYIGFFRWYLFSLEALV